MLEARISSARDSLYFAAANASPPNLRALRWYVRDFARGSRGNVVRVELHVDGTDLVAPDVQTWLVALAATGARITRTK